MFFCRKARRVQIYFKVLSTEINFSFQKAFLPKENHIPYTFRVIEYFAFQGDSAHLRTPPTCNEPLFFVTHSENILFSWLRFYHILEFARIILQEGIPPQHSSQWREGLHLDVVPRIVRPHRHLGQKGPLEVIKLQQSLQLNQTRL